MAPSTFYPFRFVSLAITALSAVTSFVITVQLLAAWRSLKCDPESEWESSGVIWRVDGVKVIWVLLSTYFAAAAAVSVIGFCGIIKNKPSFIRFYRDYSIADFSFCTFFTTIATYSVFHASTRARICEELSRHPELMRDITELGLNLENCERWLERIVLAVLALMIIIIVVRLHFLLAISNYSSQLQRHHCTGSQRKHTIFDAELSRRIFIIPPIDQSAHPDDEELVFAPVRIASLPESIRNIAAEAWISKGEPRSCQLSPTASDMSRRYYLHEQGQQRQSHFHRHHRRHSNIPKWFQDREHPSRSRSSTQAGTIQLSILPDEGLFSHDDSPGLKE